MFEYLHATDTSALYSCGMDAGNSGSGREGQLPDLDTLGPDALKALVLAQRSELDSRESEIESLKLLILKLKRMQFGPRSEKFSRDIEQLELQLEDLEVNEAAAEQQPVQAAAANAERESAPQARAPSASGAPAARNRDDHAEAGSVPGLRWQAPPAG